jgi:hypothetical protein
MWFYCIVGGIFKMKPIYVGIPEKRIERDNGMEEKPALPNNKAKSIFKRVADIVVEDVRYFFGGKQTRESIEKARENRMKYEAFMEMCRK